MTNTLSSAILCNYGTGPWGSAWGISISPHPFYTNWTNYWIYTKSSDISSADNNQYSFQQSCVSYSSTSLSASLTAMCDNYINYVYVNNIQITNYRTFGCNNSQRINITLLPGINLIEFYCQNVDGPGPAGLIFYVTHGTTGQLLCQSNTTVMYRLA